MGLDGSSWRLFDDRIRDFQAARSEGDYLYVAPDTTEVTKAKSATSVTRHTSDCCEFFLVAEGRMILDTPAETFELTPGRLLLVEPGVEHEQLAASPNDSYLSFCLMARGTTADLYQVIYLPHAHDDWLNTHVRLFGAEEVETAAHLIGIELKHRGYNWLRAANSLLQYLGQVLQRRFESGSIEYETRAMSTEFHRWPALQAALLYCAANIQRPVRLKDVAAAIGYSPSHFSRMFSQQLGVSFSTHLRNLRMSVAMDLLSRSGLPVHEIAQRIGYPYPWHFTRAFTRATGLSPRQYRRRTPGARESTA